MKMQMANLQDELTNNRAVLYTLFRELLGQDRKFLLKPQVMDVRDSINDIMVKSGSKGENLLQIFALAEEVVGEFPWIYLAVRLDIAHWKYMRINIEEMKWAMLEPDDFFLFKEKRKLPGSSSEQWVLKFDITPFEDGLPKMTQEKSVGHGVEFLNRVLSGKMFGDLKSGGEKILSFLRKHKHDGQQLMLNDSIHNLDDLRISLKAGIRYLDGIDSGLSWRDFSRELQEYGFLKGWGKNAEIVKSSFMLLADILEAPDDEALAEFISRVPMIFRIVIVSPHGYFGQSDVLGLPDTGGQVVYILDQVRALEKQIKHNIEGQGLNITPQIVVLSRLIPEAGATTCNERIEKIVGTDHSIILRVPFTESDGSIVKHWISRFNIYPYLERFVIDAQKELAVEMGSNPDLIIGNYTDGNLVSSLLSKKLNATQCTIAHALEKTKYPHSDLNWKELDDEYHFSCQFSADLYAMNSADFIITSTYQEIAGTKESAGQYESYSSFTLPGLFRVNKGIDVFDPKFNIVSPGADPEIYFPSTCSEKRLKGLHTEIARIIYGEPASGARGKLVNDKKPLLFAMSRMDHIKNVTGLLEWYANNDQLRELTNMFLVAGNVDIEKSSDEEEASQIKKMHELFDKYQLDDNVRWVNNMTDRTFNGEVYRYVADTGGAFVQPALFEAFGLTVIEAMTTGLPTFATCYGGPSEIIEDQVSGFHISPDHGQEAAEIMVEFFKKCKDDPDHWLAISENAIRRVEEKYTWKLYAQRLLSLSKIYSFWNHLSSFDRRQTGRYLDMFYGLMVRRLSQKIEKEMKSD